jgi:hypothetical protein
MTDFKHVEEQIEELASRSTSFLATGQVVSVVKNRRAADTMQALLDVAEAAKPIAENKGASYQRKKALREALAKLQEQSGE